MDTSNLIDDDDIDQSWNRCLPQWMDAGRVNDFPHGERRPRYTPTLGKRLGQQFATTFFRNVSFFITKLRDADPTVQLIAFDLLEMVAEEHQLRDNALPKELTEIEDAIPETALRDIRSDHIFKKYENSTVGSFLPYLMDHG